MYSAIGRVGGREKWATFEMNRLLCRSALIRVAKFFTANGLEIVPRIVL